LKLIALKNLRQQLFFVNPLQKVGAL